MRYVEDYAIGTTYELGFYRLEAEEIMEFGHKYDPQYYHTNSVLAKQSLFGELVASGWQITAIWMRLYVQSMLIDAAVEGSPGVDQLRWFSPVTPGSVLNGKLTIVNTSPSLSRPDCSILHKRGELFDVDGMLVMQLLLYSMFRKR